MAGIITLGKAFNLIQCCERNSGRSTDGSGLFIDAYSAL